MPGCQLASLLGIPICGVRSQRIQPGVSRRDRCRSCGGSPSARGSPWGRWWCWTRAACHLPPRSISEAAVSSEWERLDRGLEVAHAGAGRDEAEVRTRLGPQYAEILAAHSRMIADPTLRRETRQLIEQERIPAEHAVVEVLEGYASRLEQLGASHLAARAADLRDIQARILAHLIGERPRAVAKRARRADDRSDARPDPKRGCGTGPAAGARIRHRGRGPLQPHGDRGRRPGDPRRGRAGAVPGSCPPRAVWPSWTATRAW